MPPRSGFRIKLLAVRGAQKWVLTLLVVVAAASAYEADRLGVVADRGMVQNMAMTVTTEAGHLLTADFPGYFFLHAAPGLLLVFWPQLRRRKPVPAGLLWVGSQAVIVALVPGMVLPNLTSLQATAHGHRDLIDALLPGAALGAGVSGRRDAGRMRMRCDSAGGSAPGTCVTPPPPVCRLAHARTMCSCAHAQAQAAQGWTHMSSTAIEPAKAALFVQQHRCSRHGRDARTGAFRHFLAR